MDTEGHDMLRLYDYADSGNGYKRARCRSCGRRMRRVPGDDDRNASRPTPTDVVDQSLLVSLSPAAARRGPPLSEMQEEWGRVRAPRKARRTSG